MRVTVRLFARLRDLAGGSGELVRDVPSPATVQTVWNALVREMPALAEYERTMSVAVNAEYFYVLPDQLAQPTDAELAIDKDAGYKNSFSIGFDIETGGHVFQLHATNSTGMFERAYITETTGSWMNGDIHFGFNISRVFTVHTPKSKPAGEW